MPIRSSIGLVADVLFDAVGISTGANCGPRLRLGLNVLHLIEIRDQPLRGGRAPLPRLCPPSYRLMFRRSKRPSHAKVLSAAGLLNWLAVLKLSVKLT